MESYILVESVFPDNMRDSVTIETSFVRLRVSR